jgi:hypothetical protein
MTTEVSGILLACDRLLGEIGRRDHMFGWLRRPSSVATEWLTVDAYYPGNRLVVLCRPRDPEDAALCAERIPAHGLRLLEIGPHELPEDPAGRRAWLERRLAELDPVTRPTGQLATRERPAIRAASLWPQPAAQPVVRRPVGEARAAAAARGARAAATVRSSRVLAPAVATPREPRRPVTAGLSPQRVARPVQRRPAVEHPLRPAPGLFVGLALIAILCVEMFLGVAVLALSSGHILLAFGLALDACARALGTIAAQRAHRLDWVWSCALIGSPAVLMFALYGSEEPVAAEPAPLAGLLSLLALLAVGIFLIGQLLHF